MTWYGAVYSQSIWSTLTYLRLMSFVDVAIHYWCDFEKCSFDNKSEGSESSTLELGIGWGHYELSMILSHSKGKKKLNLPILIGRFKF